LLNNAAIATFYARVRWGLERIAVVDIDVHFGNGTAEILRNDPKAFFASVHMVGFFFLFLKCILIIIIKKQKRFMANVMMEGWKVIISMKDKFKKMDFIHHEWAKKK
jgi:acetoin utilization deacetylase AcuC-like enzyme